MVLSISVHLRMGQIGPPPAIDQTGTGPHPVAPDLGQTPQRPAHPRQRPQAGGGPVDGTYIPQVLKIVDDGQHTGAHRLTWGIDHAALEQLETEVFGKRS